MGEARGSSSKPTRCASEHSAAADCPSGGMLGHYFWAAVTVAGLALSLKPLVATFMMLIGRGAG